MGGPSCAVPSTPGAASRCAELASRRSPRFLPHGSEPPPGKHTLQRKRHNTTQATFVPNGIGTSPFVLAGGGSKGNCRYMWWQQEAILTRMESTSDKEHWFRFRLTFVLIAFVVAAVLLTIGSKLYVWYHATPTMPLADAVREFNSRYASDSVRKHEPPITGREIVASIRAQLPTLAASQQVKNIFSEIHIQDGFLLTRLWTRCQVGSYKKEQTIRCGGSTLT